jgi:hypothetical protein
MRFKESKAPYKNKGNEQTHGVWEHKIEKGGYEDRIFFSRHGRWVI